MHECVREEIECSCTLRSSEHLTSFFTDAAEDAQDAALNPSGGVGGFWALFRSQGPVGPQCVAKKVAGWDRVEAEESMLMECSGLRPRTGNSKTVERRLTDQRRG